METKYAGFQKIITWAYLLLILAVLPIYMKDGFYMLADAKYLFFRGVSLIFLVLWLLGAALSCAGWWWRYRNRPLKENRAEWSRAHSGFSGTDYFALGFAGISVLSYVFSNYKDTALVGYSGWYMGLLTQLFLVGGYFLVSRWYEREKLISTIVWLSAAAVCLLGVLNRQGYDPLGTFRNMDWWDWDRRNLLSTVGNINWYCGYLSVAVPLLLYCFWAGEGWERIPAGIAAFTGIAAVALQGSTSGYMMLMAMYVVLLLGSLREMERFLRFLEAAVLVPLFYFAAWATRMELLLPYDAEGVLERICTPFWGIPLGMLGAGTAVLRLIYRRSGKNYLESGRALKAAQLLLITAAIGAAAVFVGCQMSDAVWHFFGNFGLLRFDAEWGSMRGGLWTAAWNGFCRSGFVRKLYGVGPDCFARYFYEVETIDIKVSGQWAEALYANAHNEWLNMLINEGILGFVAYLGFFFSGFRRFWQNYSGNRRMMAGMMAVGAYVANQFFSFGQVVSTPLIFLVIAVCENECRRAEAGKESFNGRE